MFLSFISGESYPDAFTSNPVTVSVAQESGTGEKMFSEKEICQLTKGCWSENECYPYGYRVEEKYCGFDKDYKEKYKFDKFSVVNQSESGAVCENSFECKSNFCFKRECVDTLIESDGEEVIRINKSDLEELRSIIEDTEEMIEEDYDEDVFRSFFSSLRNLFKRMFSW